MGKNALLDAIAESYGGNSNALMQGMRNGFQYRGPQQAGMPSARQFGESLSMSGVPIVSDLASGALAAADAANGDYGSAAMNAVGLLPFVPGVGGVIKYGKGFDESKVKDLISSQRFLDRDIVAKKIKENDFNVNVTPDFEIDGRKLRAITDGHHSLEAARISRNNPVFIVDTPKTNDKIGLLGQPDDYLEAAYHDSNWYEWLSKKDLW